MFKKLIAIAISVLTVISSSSVMCFAAETDIEPDVAETLKSGDYEYTAYGNSATIMRYTGSEKVLVVPSELQGKTVVYIGFNAFANNKSITSVTIPESVSYISHGAFSGCTNLASIDPPKSPSNSAGPLFRTQRITTTVKTGRTALFILTKTSFTSTKRQRAILS
ncbi:MAG: leucine-rich repeat protein [Ruminococcus sp.]|nr:leucine-rich repeat protein [Ruminococcus sp.]